MKKEITTIIFVLLTLAIVFAPFAQAAILNPKSIDVGPSETRDLSSLPSQNVSAQGGNVTRVNIDVLTITKSWQGYFGNITGEIVLDDADNNTFYNWTLTNVDGEVYASRAASPTWASLDCADAANVTAEESYLGHIAADGDSVSNTFALSYPATLQAGSTTVSSGCDATRMYENEAQSAANYWELLLTDGANIVYTTVINDSATGYDGGAYDFQMLVGENEHAGSEGSTTYYFFVELG